VDATNISTASGGSTRSGATPNFYLVQYGGATKLLYGGVLILRSFTLLDVYIYRRGTLLLINTLQSSYILRHFLAITFSLASSTFHPHITVFAFTALFTSNSLTANHPHIQRRPLQRLLHIATPRDTSNHHFNQHVHQALFQYAVSDISRSTACGGSEYTNKQKNHMGTCSRHKSNMRHHDR
jgi:hypothetical protein